MERIRDPIHGFVGVRPVEAALIDTPTFQRLRRIHQLGLTSYVYPGAEHSRFTHAIGAMHVAGQLAETLGREGWNGSVTLARVGALLHDVGHPPLSHAGERRGGHEAMSARLIREGELARVLRAHGIDPDAVAALLDGSGDPVAAAIVSGEVDADRMDYLLRDSHMCGVRYGEYDLARLIESVTLVGERVAVKRSGLHAVEGLLLARYSMFLQVYFHRTRRILDLLLDEVLPDWPADIDTWLGWDDARVFEFLRTSEHPAARMIRGRDLPRCVVEIELGQNPTARAEADRLTDAVREVVSRAWVDSTARVTAFQREGDVTMREEDGSLGSVYAASPVLRRVDAEVEIRRVYVLRPEAVRARAAVTSFRRQGSQLRLF